MRTLKPSAGETESQLAVTQELTTGGIESMLRVALATEDAAMRDYWTELEPRILQNLDLLSADQLSSILAVPHWQERISHAFEQLSPETQWRIDVLSPRSAIGRIWHAVRRRLASWSLPEGITLAEADAVIRAYRGRIAQTNNPLHSDGLIALMNEIIKERYQDLDEPTQRNIRFYFYERENLIGAG